MCLLMFREFAPIPEGAFYSGGCSGNVKINKPRYYYCFSQIVYSAYILINCQARFFNKSSCDVRDSLLFIRACLVTNLI